MYLKFIIVQDKITYTGVKSKKLQMRFMEAADFIQKILNITQDTTVGYTTDRHALSCIYLSITIRACYDPHKKLIYLGPYRKNTNTIIHETIHHLANVGILPEAKDVWLATTMGYTYLLVKLLENGKSLDLAKSKILIEDAPPFRQGYRSYKVMKQKINGYDIYKDRLLVQYSDLWTGYFEQDIAELAAIRDFDWYNRLEFNTERYHKGYENGAFILGIIRGILEDTHNIELVSLFLHQLIDRAPLEYAISRVILSAGKSPAPVQTSSE